MAAPVPKRRWSRFSLRMLLILIAVIAVPLAWVAKERRQSRYETLLAEELDKQNAVAVWLGGPFDEWRLPRNKPQSGWRDLARKAFGERILEVSCGAQNFEDLTPLTRLSSLQALNVGGMDLDYMERDGELQRQRDLAPLAKLTNLRWINLSHCWLPDLTPLARLPNLTVLNLYETDVTQDQVDALQTALPNCEVRITGARKPRLRE